MAVTKYRVPHFEEYIQDCSKFNLHENYQDIYKNNFPSSLKNLKNLIFYGPSGIGKYTQMLYSIRKYSPSDLKYEKKLIVNFNKKQYIFKISDIHFEIDVSLLGCNSKLLWHEIYCQILDAISAKSDKTGIIVCRNFHDIHTELLENFYSYMQQNNLHVIKVIFFIITDEISFIPDNILNSCQILSFSRPRKSDYAKLLLIKNGSKLPKNLDVSSITNISCLLKNFNATSMKPHEIICKKIIQQICNLDTMKFTGFRDVLYDVFIYNLNITNCIWFILRDLREKKLLNDSSLSKTMKDCFGFFQYYNNNYRPIYHMEKFLLQLATSVHNI